MSLDPDAFSRGLGTTAPGTPVLESYLGPAALQSRQTHSPGVLSPSACFGWREPAHLRFPVLLGSPAAGQGAGSQFFRAGPSEGRRGPLSRRCLSFATSPRERSRQWGPSRPLTWASALQPHLPASPLQCCFRCFLHAQWCWVSLLARLEVY